MKITVTKFEISNELDIVLAHKRAGQLCDLTGIGFYGRTSFITAVSEICRNVIEHATKGKIVFNVNTSGSMIEAVISDKGKGIKDADYFLTRTRHPDLKGCGLQNAKKLVDVFTLNTSEKGTTIVLGIKTNPKSLPVSKAIITEWAEYFKEEKPTSPYEEIKRQNNQLLEITDQLRLKQMETSSQLEQIKNLNNQLNKTNQELEDFASTLSHDLRSPISNLKMLISIIESSNKVDKSEYTMKFKSQVDRLDDMILSLAEIIDLRNTQNITVNKVNFEDILNVVREELKREIETSQSIIDADFHIQPYIHYYEVYLHSIMLNLVSNSIKYRSDKPPVIKITSDRNGNSIILTVEDNGIGMDLNKISNHLFKPFRRFNEDKEGKGIGLHIIKGMVEKNGGHIDVQSHPGQGSRFTVSMIEY